MQTPPRFPAIKIRICEGQSEWELIKTVHNALYREGISYEDRRAFLIEALDLNLEDYRAIIAVIENWVTVQVIN